MYKLAITACVVLSVIGCTSPARIQIPPVEPRTAYASTMHPNVILVLGSGSARGFAHAGVLKALEKNHIHIDMIVGTSAGSIVGALYAGNPHADSLEKLLLTTPKNQVIQFSPFNIFSGPFSGDKLQNYLIANIKATSFDQLAIPLVAVATDLETGNSHAFSSGPIAPAVNASSAAPPYFKPVVLYGKTFIDGGFVDPVAVDIARSYHPKIIIAVDLSPVLSAQSPKTNPSLFLRGFEIMLTQLAKRSAQGADVVIHPHLDDISMFEGVGREQSMSAGYSATMEKMPAIRELFLKNKMS